jgi:hypothetical protein
MRLLIYHLLGDWLFQPAEWAKKKTSDYRYLFVHALTYSLIVLIPVWGYPNFWLIAAIIFFTHFFIDTRKPTIWWIKYIKRDKEAPMWLVFVIDQVFHIIILYFIWRYLM